MAKHPAAVSLGRLGGRSRSRKKLAAVRANLAKARQVKAAGRPMERREASKMAMTITNYTEPVTDWNAAITKAVTLPDLILAIEPFQRIAADAVDIVAHWTAEDFKDWRKALASERRGRFMGEKAAARFAAVLMPEVMFRVSVYAMQFKAPWGLTFNRLCQVGKITETNGIASFVEAVA